MGLFSGRKAAPTGGATIEINSGGVVLSVIVRNTGKRHPTLVWSTRELTSFTITKTREESYKQLMSALMAAMMRLGQGAKTLRETHGLTIDDVLVIVGAPWSFTVSKEIVYQEPAPFTVTKELIENLVSAAIKKIEEDLVEDHKAKLNALTILDRRTTNYLLNGYPVEKPFGLKAETLVVSEMSTLADTAVYKNSVELCSKVLARADIQGTSSMVTLFAIADQLFPGTADYCLVDISYEATELAIVRNRLVRYATHAPVGLNTVARALGKQLNLPEGEAQAMLREPYFSTARERMSQAEQTAVETIFAEYRTVLATLFHETGDNLSIPKVIFLHGHNSSELFLKVLVSDAAKAATNITHTVHELTEHILEANYDAAERLAVLRSVSDDSQILAIQFFGTNPTHRD